MELTLSLWMPTPSKDGNYKDTDELLKNKPIRKLYKNNKKELIDFAYYWKELDSFTNEETTLYKVKHSVERVRNENLNVCIGSNSPQQNIEYTDPKTKKTEIFNKEYFRRLGAVLKNEDRNWIFFDCDKCYPEVHPQMSTRERVKVLEDKLSILNHKGLVAWPSSSAYFLDTSIDKDTGLPKTHRLNLHVLVILDKPSDSGTIKHFLDAHKHIVDEAMSRVTQPHIIANPIFENTSRHLQDGEAVYLREGDKLNIEKYVRQVSAGKGIPRHIRRLPTHMLSLEKALVKKLENSPEDGDRNNLFLDLARREVNRLKGEYPGELRQILLNPVILGQHDETFIEDKITFALACWRESEIGREIFNSNNRTRGDNYSKLEEISEKYNEPIHRIQIIDNQKKLEIRDRQLGKGKGTLDWDVKEIKQLDLADYDIKEVPTEGIICLKSGCGTGKTKGWIKEYLKHAKAMRVLYISVYKGTIDPFVLDMSDAGFNITNYQAVDATDAEDYAKHSLLAITDKSIPHLFKGNHYLPYDGIIIDECEHVFMGELKEKSHIGSHIEQLVTDSKWCLFLDADISETVTGWAAITLANTCNTKACLYRNTADYLEDMKVCALPSQDQALQTIDNALKEGKSVFCHVGINDDLKKIQAMCDFFEDRYKHLNRGRGILCEGHDATDTPELRRLKKDSVSYLNARFDEDRPLRLLIVSPWATIGWDFNSDKHKFDETVGIYDGQHKSGEDVVQGMRRPRRTEKHTVFINRQAGYQPKKAQEEAQEEAIEGYKDIKLPFSEELGDRARERKLILSENPSYQFKTLVEERGGDYEEITVELEKGLRKLIGIMGINALNEEIKAIFENDYQKEEFLLGFKRCPIESEIDSINTDLSDIDGDSIDLEQFTTLYMRDKKIKESEISEILHIWQLKGDSERRTHNKLENYVAINKGKLLDEIDRLIDYSGLNQDLSFLDYCKNRKSKELQIYLNTDRIKNLSNLLAHVIDGGDSGHFFKKKHRTQTYVWVEEFFLAMDFDVEMKEGRPKKDVKKEIIQDYAGAKKLKGIEGVGRRIDYINQVIDGKIEAGKVLTVLEADWKKVDGKTLIIKFKDIEMNKVNSKIKKSLIASRAGKEFYGV